MGFSNFWYAGQLAVLHYMTRYRLGMLNEVWIFEVHFNYSYSNSRAANSIVVCKCAEGVNSRWHEVDRGGGLQVACHLSQWAGGGVGGMVGGMAAVMQWQDKHQVAPSMTPRGVILYGLITSGMSGQAARRDVWQTVSNDTTLGNGVPVKDHRYWLWSGSLSHRWRLLWPTITGVCRHFLSATVRAVSKSHSRTRLLPEHVHVECLE